MNQTNSEFGIVEERKSEGFKCLIIDTKKANYQGHPYRTLGDYGKRKFENLIFLSNAGERVKINYI